MKIMKKVLSVLAAAFVTLAAIPAFAAENADISYIMDSDAYKKMEITANREANNGNPVSNLYDGSVKTAFQPTPSDPNKDNVTFSISTGKLAAYKGVRIYNYNTNELEIDVYKGESSTGELANAVFETTAIEAVVSDSGKIKGGMTAQEADAGKTYTIMFKEPVTSQFFKLYIKDPTRVQLCEIVFIEDTGNLLSGADIKTSNGINATYPLAQMTDGDFYTRVALTSTRDTEFEVDLGSEKAFNALECHDFKESGYATKYEIYTGTMGDDGSIAYSEAPAATVAPTSKDYNGLFNSITAQYIKIKVTGMNSVRELGLYNLEISEIKNQTVKPTLTNGNNGELTASVVINNRYTDSGIKAVLAVYENGVLKYVQTDKAAVNKNTKDTVAFDAFTVDSSAESKVKIFYFDGSGTITPVFGNDTF